VELFVFKPKEKGYVSLKEFMSRQADRWSGTVYQFKGGVKPAALSEYPAAQLQKA
jgi:hypothetical protein